MTDGQCSIDPRRLAFNKDSITLKKEETPPDCLHSFAAWIDLNPPPIQMVAGMLELLGNELYRQGRFMEGGEVKHVAGVLRSGQL